MAVGPILQRPLHRNEMKEEREDLRGNNSSRDQRW
jgi:hypothetical protein